MRKPTIYQIKKAVEDHCSLFFSRENMKHAGQTLKDFTIEGTEKEGVFKISAPCKDFYGNYTRETTRYFSMETKRLSIEKPGL